MTEEIIIAGFGGQGVLSMGKIIAYSGIMQDLEVCWMPSYGPEMRGGTANSTVIVSDKKIASPITDSIDVLCAMNGSSLEKFSKDVVPGGFIFINSGMIKEPFTKPSVKSVYLDPKKMALALGNEKVANVVMLGAVLSEINIMETGNMDDILEYIFQGKSDDIVSLNTEAISLWEKEKHRL